jgi:hypothetical protein
MLAPAVPPADYAASRIRNENARPLPTVHALDYQHKDCLVAQLLAFIQQNPVVPHTKPVRLMVKLFAYDK